MKYHNQLPSVQECWLLLRDQVPLSTKGGSSHPQDGYFLAQLAGKKIFSRLHANSAFWQITFGSSSYYICEGFVSISFHLEFIVL